VAATRLALSRTATHVVCDLVRQGVRLSDVSRGLGLRDQALSHALFLGHHDGPERYVTFARWLEDARLEREQVVAELIEAARQNLGVTTPAGRARRPGRPAAWRP
jgi:hypothetical protein